VLDRKWREHLYEMDYLQEGIGLRAMAQRDPLIEYQREGYQLFEAMMDSIKEESVSHLFSVEVQVSAPAQPAGAVTPVPVSQMLAGLATAGTQAAAPSEATAGAEEEPVAVSAAGPEVRLSGVDLRTGSGEGSAFSYSAPGEYGSVVRTGGQRPVERPANRRGKKVKRKRR
jgi:preprotein translocase subunit SecA